MDSEQKAEFDAMLAGDVGTGEVAARPASQEQRKSESLLMGAFMMGQRQE